MANREAPGSADTQHTNTNEPHAETNERAAPNFDGFYSTDRSGQFAAAGNIGTAINNPQTFNFLQVFLRENCSTDGSNSPRNRSHDSRTDHDPDIHQVLEQL